MAIQKWKLIRRQAVLDHPRMKLVEDTVLLPDKTEASYLRQRPVTSHSVAVIAVNKDNQVLLQQEYSYPPDDILWQLPGGGVHDNEEIEAAAVRELSEESGLIARDCSVLGYFYTNNRRSDEKQFVVLCKDLEPQKAVSDPEEFIDSEWMDLQEIHRLIDVGAITNVFLLAALQLWEHSTAK